MKKIIKMLCVVISLSILTTLFGAAPFKVFAADLNGQCGENAFYELNETTQTLIISGSGSMFNYDNSVAPFSVRDMIYQSVIIEEGITSIGNAAFFNRSKLLSVRIPDSVETIGILAFYGCSNLTSVTIGSGVSDIGLGAFADCSNLKDVFFNGCEEEWNSIEIAEENIWLSAAEMHFLNTDNSAFSAAIEEAASYTKAYYTKETIEALTAVTEKYAYLVNEEAPQFEYDTATAEIINAIRNLDALSNYSLLKIRGNTVFLVKNGFITVLNFEEYSNQFCPSLDVVDDGVVNAKDYAYLIKNYTEKD